MHTIEYKVSFEKMISRLPGLFAYLESDDYGVVSLHKATDSLDGCWGKLVENIKLPQSLVVDGETILNANETYTFRTIIDYYYQYRNDLDKEDEFLKFIEKGIGKIEVPKDKRSVATPEFLYLSNVKRLYNELVKMDKQCEFYEKNLDKGLTDKDKHLCCLCERYEKMGGDDFKNYVGSLIPQAESIAEEYKGYADNENSMALDFVIDLKSTYRDFGILTPYAPTWIPGRRYKIGDKVEYNGELYNCIIENNGRYDEKYLRIVFDDTKFERCCSEFIDEKTNSISKTIINVGDVWYDGECIKHIAQNRDVGRNVMAYNLIQTDENCNLTEPIKIGDVTDTDSKIMTDSKLVNMRRFVTYYNDDGIAERPEVGEDWLFYYRKGVAVNIRTINDDLGNVLSYSQPEDENGNKRPSTDEEDLMAYGDVIEDIVADRQNHKIKFIYRIGVHLNADGAAKIDYDDDGNELIKWNKFIWDNDDKIGIKYEEEYNYEEESDLNELVNNNFKPKDENGNVIGTFNFNDYIQGNYDKQLPSYKFEFITINNSFEYNKTIAHQDVNIVSLLTNFEIYRKDFDEFTSYETIRDDYFNGITYKPTKNIDVNIQRGSTSVFDKHIAFGEVKTMEDMETYKNSSFFRMTEG